MKLKGTKKQRQNKGEKEEGVGKGNKKAKQKKWGKGNKKNAKRVNKKKKN
jgi:hypothetical protein